MLQLRSTWERCGADSTVLARCGRRTGACFPFSRRTQPRVTARNPTAPAETGPLSWRTLRLTRMPPYMVGANNAQHRCVAHMCLSSRQQPARRNFWNSRANTLQIWTLPRLVCCARGREPGVSLTISPVVPIWVHHSSRMALMVRHQHWRPVEPTYTCATASGMAATTSSAPQPGNIDRATLASADCTTAGYGVFASMKYYSTWVTEVAQVLIWQEHVQLRLCLQPMGPWLTLTSRQMVYRPRPLTTSPGRLPTSQAFGFVGANIADSSLCRHLVMHL